MKTVPGSKPFDLYNDDERQVTVGSDNAQGTTTFPKEDIKFYLAEYFPARRKHLKYLVIMPSSSPVRRIAAGIQVKKVATKGQKKLRRSLAKTNPKTEEFIPGNGQRADNNVRQDGKLILGQEGPQNEFVTDIVAY